MQRHRDNFRHKGVKEWLTEYTFWKFCQRAHHFEDEKLLWNEKKPITICTLWHFLTTRRPMQTPQRYYTQLFYANRCQWQPKNKTSQKYCRYFHRKDKKGTGELKGLNGSRPSNIWCKNKYLRYYDRTWRDLRRCWETLFENFKEGTQTEKITISGKTQHIGKIKFPNFIVITFPLQRTKPKIVSSTKKAQSSYQRLKSWWLDGQKPTVSFEMSLQTVKIVVNSIFFCIFHLTGYQNTAQTPCFRFQMFS